MTTAGRPTWDSAKGGQGKWEKDLGALSKHYSVRDIPSHTKLKYRQEGQGRPEELQGRDFKRELEEKEKRLAAEKALKSSNIAAISSSSDSSVQNEKKSITLAALPSNSSLDQGSASKRPRMSFLASRAPIPSAAALAAVPTANLDADDPWEEDYDEDEVATAPKKPTLEGEEDDDATDDEEEDEEALLMELAKIKRERAEEIAKQAAERRAAEETIRIDNILRGNPLLTRNDNPTEFKVKRRWDDDVVFKNCARGEIDHAKRGFINDTLRSEFHKKFMKKYIH